MVARAFEYAGADQDTLDNEVLKVARGRGARSAGDRVGRSGLSCELFVNHLGNFLYLPSSEK